MNPIKVLLIHRDSDIYRNLTGWWSYPVDEFEWVTLKVKPLGFVVDMKYAPPCDLIVLDDWIFGTVQRHGLPLAYVVVDSMRSPAQLERNRQQAYQADLILVDSDRLTSFAGLGAPVQRFAYAVNERLFYPQDKVYDVAFLCWPTPARREMQKTCATICKRHGWSFLTGTYEWHDYANFICRSKVVVHLPHVQQGRSWRVFDVMAARGALLTKPLPAVSGDGLIIGLHHREYSTAEMLESELIKLLDDGEWEAVAAAGYDHVLAHHTWTKRAAQLRGILHETFKHDERRMALW